ncbi:MAG: presqualene diphosphate synthase HpnD [Burkholderiales bacterium]|jgi:phytoene synthase|nr:presqualene diphosphate synthase HpnD [Burkholderiales bacterium]
MTPDEYCQQKAVQSGSSFYYSFLFLPPERRRAITAVYAYCREVDDAVDEVQDPEVARATLAWWHGEVAALYAGTPTHPVTRALAPFLEPFAIRKERLEEILAGMEMDLTHPRHPDFASLQRYAYLVAGSVGIVAAGIFGHTDARTLEYAEKLGIAFQLTNIIRDVGEDARRNRIYLPLDELARFDVPAADILAARATENFRALMAFQAERAERWYEDAFAALPAADRRSQRPGLVMAAIYRTLLDEIRRDGYPVLTERVSLTPVRKLWLAWKTWMTA